MMPSRLEPSQWLGHQQKKYLFHKRSHDLHPNFPH